MTFTEDGYAHPSGGGYDLVFWEAPDLRSVQFDVRNRRNPTESDRKGSTN